MCVCVRVCVCVYVHARVCVCGGGGGANFMYQTTRSKVSVVKFIIEKEILWLKERWAAVECRGFHWF